MLIKTYLYDGCLSFIIIVGGEQHHAPLLEPNPSNMLYANVDFIAFIFYALISNPNTVESTAFSHSTFTLNQVLRNHGQNTDRIIV